MARSAPASEAGAGASEVSTEGITRPITIRKDRERRREGEEDIFVWEGGDDSERKQNMLIVKRNKN